ncbi:MAG: hypothetical protein AAGA48_13800 [Myxococcota bacterium]
MTAQVIPWLFTLTAYREVVGDWQAINVSTLNQRSTASGILEIDRDGETLLDIEFTGEGPSGTIRAIGITDLENRFSLVGTFGPDDRPIGIEGTWNRSDQSLVCLFDLDDVDWTLLLRRASR